MSVEPSAATGPRPAEDPYPVEPFQQRQAHRLRLALAGEGCYPPPVASPRFVAQAREEIPLYLALLDDRDACALWDLILLLYHVPIPGQLLALLPILAR